jgi:four helix bundle protein
MLPAMGMKTPYDIQERCFLFACRTITFCRTLASRDLTTRRLSWQLLDAGTSIGANMEEAHAGQTKPDFISKVAIARKECREARYWLRLIAFAEPSAAMGGGPLLDEATQLLRILTTIIKNARSTPRRGEET